jgi:hypothetical protein
VCHGGRYTQAVDYAKRLKALQHSMWNKQQRLICDVPHDGSCGLHSVFVPLGMPCGAEDLREARIALQAFVEGQLGNPIVQLAFLALEGIQVPSTPSVGSLPFGGFIDVLNSSDDEM